MTSAGSAAAPVSVLVVEDNPVDANMVKYALDEVQGWPVTIALVEDGDEAIDYLKGTGKYTAATMPDLVVLDLNLPKCPGTDVLRMIRKSVSLRNLKVVILSSSPMDVIEGCVRDADVHPDCCFTKPLGLDEFLAIGEEIRRCYQGENHLSGC